jgi:clan AA aspartic protease
MISEQPEKNKMARFYVNVELANNDDLAAVRRGNLTADKVRRVTVRALVDCGASGLVLPKKIVEQLGMPVTGQVKVKYADRRIVKRAEVSGVFLELQGRDSIFKATVEPKCDTALIGALVLESLDFLVDSKKECLVPRDPKYIIAEEESGRAVVPFR